MHWKYTCSKTSIAIIGVLAILRGGIAVADSVTGLNTFSPGQAARAGDVNANFDAVKSAVDDNDARVSTLETTTPSQLDFSGYGVPFSADGAAKNVVVLSRIDSNGDTQYSVRSRYENSTEQISINGVPTVRPFIANYVNVGADDSGIIFYINNYIEAPDTANYVSYNIETSTYDINTLAKTVEVDGDILHESWECGDSGLASVSLCYGYQTLSLDGSFQSLYDWTRNYALAGPITLNGLTFPDVRLASLTGTRDQFRIRAKGIGDVYHRTRSSTGEIIESTIIYYRVDGSTGGSLAGTPFNTGQPLDGLFF